jgi:hypothetical protein
MGGGGGTVNYKQNQLIKKGTYIVSLGYFTQSTYISSNVGPQLYVAPSYVPYTPSILMFSLNSDKTIASAVIYDIASSTYSLIDNTLPSNFIFSYSAINPSLDLIYGIVNGLENIYILNLSNNTFSINATLSSLNISGLNSSTIRALQINATGTILHIAYTSGIVAYNLSTLVATIIYSVNVSYAKFSPDKTICIILSNVIKPEYAKYIISTNTYIGMPAVWNRGGNNNGTWSGFVDCSITANNAYTYIYYKSNTDVYSPLYSIGLIDNNSTTTSGANVITYKNGNPYTLAGIGWSDVTPTFELCNNDKNIIVCGNTNLNNEYNILIDLTNDMNIIRQNIYPDTIMKRHINPSGSLSFNYKYNPSVAAYKTLPATVVTNITGTNVSYGGGNLNINTYDPNYGVAIFKIPKLTYPTPFNTIVINKYNYLTVPGTLFCKDLVWRNIPAYTTSNVINSIALNNYFVNSNSFCNLMIPYTTSNVIQNIVLNSGFAVQSNVNVQLIPYITSNGFSNIALNSAFINSNILNNILIPYTTSNTIANIVLNNSFVNSNALSNILLGYQYLSNILNYVPGITTFNTKINVSTLVTTSNLIWYNIPPYSTSNYNNIILNDLIIPYITSNNIFNVALNNSFVTSNTNINTINNILIPYITSNTIDNVLINDGFITSNTVAVSLTKLNNALINTTTAQIVEGSNLYYTLDRANQQFDLRLSTKTTSE